MEAAFALVEEGDALLVVGSSLTVYSGYRFVVRASERRMPIAILNLGECRGVELADVRVEARAGDVLPRLARGAGPELTGLAAVTSRRRPCGP